MTLNYAISVQSPGRITAIRQDLSCNCTTLVRSNEGFMNEGIINWLSPQNDKQITTSVAPFDRYPVIRRTAVVLTASKWGTQCGSGSRGSGRRNAMGRSSGMACSNPSDAKYTVQTANKTGACPRGNLSYRHLCLIDSIFPMCQVIFVTEEPCFTTRFILQTVVLLMVCTV